MQVRQQSLEALHVVWMLMLLHVSVAVACHPEQDAVWAEQAHVFPQWRMYKAELSQRAALAERRWADSIGLSGKKDSKADSKADSKTDSRAGGNGQQQRQRSASTRRGAAGSSNTFVAGSLRGVAGGRNVAGAVFGRAWLKRVAGNVDVQ
jgi:hypothetical protein